MGSCTSKAPNSRSIQRWSRELDKAEAELEQMAAWMRGAYPELVDWISSLREEAEDLRREAAADCTCLHETKCPNSQEGDTWASPELRGEDVPTRLGIKKLVNLEKGQYFKELPLPSGYRLSEGSSTSEQSIQLASASLATLVPSHSYSNKKLEHQGNEHFTFFSFNQLTIHKSRI
ncbi:hypothetical protein NP233_g10095 [Leucocoprinus birnbaumii]|uniref:Uncharacterized protein n=1 Tax=Leucocoprinus birnbaumii TaxID=56174 RepID=A0AAD5VJF9_9AGAR|nr:hypothetical protein NP233_g10095 [Leucocoprinus birnbaumii]